MSLIPVGRRLCAVVLFAWAAPAWASDIGHEVADQVSLASYQHYLDDLLYTHNGHNRNALTGPDKLPARDNIVATFESFGLDVELEPFTYSGTTCYNVIATQLGTVYPDAYYVIGAHYDSASNPGADDNASGVAGVLEIARNLSAYESEYTIKYMAFDAEEYGMIGSDYYVDNHYYDDIRGMISLDMIAWNTGSNKAEVYGFSSCAAIKIAMNSAIAQYGQGLTAQLFTESYSRSDHGPFQSAGFQACLLIEGNPDGNPCYHTSCDSVDNAGYINYAYALKMTRSVAGYLADNALVFYPIDCETGQGCELGVNGDEDCNANAVWDYCDIRCGTSEDVNLNGVPDECEPYQAWYVNCANCPGPGTGSEVDPFCKIQDAINAASSGVGAVVEIVVADGVYTGTGNKDLDFGGKLLTLRSANGAANCIIDCEGSGRGFYFHSGETAAAVVSGFTIRDGYVTGSSSGGAYGGGVLCSGASPTLSNCIISGNMAASVGGGVYCSSSSLWLSNCSIIANTGGGGVYCGSASSPILSGCTINGNTGGGVRCYASNPILTGCAISGNTSTSLGGGVYCSSSNPTLTNCTISGNTSTSGGGGVYCSSSNPTLTNCTISGNTSASRGGGVYCYSYSDAVFTNCAISGNTATATGTNSNAYGGGIYCSSSGPTLNNCTISENTLTGTNRYGGGVYCDQSSPNINDCLIGGNKASSSGGGGVYCGSASSPILSGCTINGNTGTGVHCDSSSPTLTNCLVSNNSYGGVYCKYASPTLTNCIIIANAASYGGGLAGYSSSNPVLTNCTISKNLATSGGGGVYCSSSSPTLTNCMIDGNRTSGGSGSGGGLSCVSSSNPTLSGCTIKRNTTTGDDGYGGGVYCFSSNPTLTNCAISGNRTTGSKGYGGGGYCSSSSPTLSNCTISRNTSAASGGGLYCASSSSPRLANCVLWGDAPQEIYVYSGSPVVTYCDVQGGWTGTGNINADPGFAFTDDFHLMPNSPCIDTGTNDPPGGLPAQDAESTTRPQDGDGDGQAVADMGAYEFNPAGSAIALSPPAFEIFAYAGDSSPEPQTLLIRNCGGGSLVWQIAEDCPWLSVDPPSGSCQAEMDSVGVSVDTTGLAAGEYSCKLTVSDPGATNSPRTVQVALHLGATRQVPAEYATIQAAINAATQYDRVVVSDGVWTGAGNKDLDLGGKAIKVSSLNGAADCVIDCQGSGRGFYFHSGETAETVVEGLTIRNGSNGGVHCSNQSSPTLTNCTISGNTAASTGGGVYCYNRSNPTLTNCTISGNTAASTGGGVYCYNRSNPTLTNCTISGNRTTGTYSNGGGLYCYVSSSPTLTNCTISGNAATSCGGGVYCYVLSSPTLTNCTISGNTATSSGAGAYCYDRSNPMLTNCTISKNIATSSGGGVYCAASSKPTLTGCEISENVAGGSSGSGQGGGLSCYSSNLVLTDCTISHNTATGSSGYGGGVYCEGSNPTLDNCIITANAARATSTYSDAHGGGIYCSSSNPVLSNCTIGGNATSAPSEGSSCGGGVYCESSSPGLIQCSISGNKTGGGNTGGGAMFCYGASNPTLTNCTIRGNKASYGGGLLCSGSDPVLVNCTISRNTADLVAGALCCWDSDPRFTNCILWGNAPQEIYVYSGSPVVTYCDVQGAWAGTGNLNIDPGFAFPDDFHLMPGSPCIDTGTDTPSGGLPSEDAEGNPRPQDGDGDGQAVADMGAYEFNPTSQAIALSPPTFEIFAYAGDPSPESQTLSIRNCSSGALVWQIAQDCPWLSVVPPSGSCQQEIDSTTVSFDTTGLAAGEYSCDLIVSAPGAANSPRTVQVTLHLGASRYVPAEFPTIQAALNAATQYDRVLVSDGIWTGAGNKNLDFGGKTIRVSSLNGPASCIIDCEASGRGFYFHGGETAEAVVEGFTIRNGKATSSSPGGAYGGGVYCSSSSPTLANCVISGNTVGGGVYCYYSSATLVDCTIIGNSGRGVYCYSSSNPTLSNCLLSSNPGGGLYCSESSPFLTNCTISGNTTTSTGGGVYCSSSSPTLTNCTINGNTVSGSTGKGGGAYCSSSSPTLTNCILWGDTPQEIYVSTGTPVVSYSDIQGGWTGTGNLDINPLFVDAANGDFHLASNSPCIDAGDPASDYSLEPEPDGGRINMGAYGNTPEAESKGWLYIKGYSLVEKTRVGRTLWDYRLSVRVENRSSTDATAVSLELLGMPGNVSIIDGQVDVGSVPAGATVTSTDTFTIRVDRQTLTSALGISWRVSYAVGGVTEDRTFAGSLGREILEPSHTPAVPEPLPPQETAGGPSRPTNAATKPG